jgi:hypothetical protein
VANPDFWEAVLGVVGAALPGVLVALVAQYLTQRRENQRQRRTNANTRMLVALELDANRAVLATFWSTINALDAKQHDDIEAHLAAMAENGLLGYPLPAWSLQQWERLSARAAGALSPKEIERVYALYADLRALDALYPQLVTIPPQELKEYESGSSARFWYNSFAGRRVGLFQRLHQTVQRVLDGDHPLA